MPVITLIEGRKTYEPVGQENIILTFSNSTFGLGGGWKADNGIIQIGNYYDGRFEG